MKHIFILVAVLLIAVVLVSVFIVFSPRENPFYVGVTFGGSTAAEAKQLIDKVKDYTNLFVVQSGSLQSDIINLENTKLENICDYAVDSGLDIIVYVGSFESYRNITAAFVDTAQKRWGSRFLGVYYGDEPGGKMLDAYVNLGMVSSVTSEQNNGTVFPAYSYRSMLTKQIDGGVTVYNDTSSLSYYPDGRIIVMNWGDPSVLDDTFQLNGNITTYYPNGTITLMEINGNFFTMENGTDRISQVESYEDVSSRNPIPNCDAAAEIFVNSNQEVLEGLNKQSSLNQSCGI
jgi:hypothetical protein